MMMSSRMFSLATALVCAGALLAGCDSGTEESAKTGTQTGAAAADAYPLTTCVVSDHALDSMGEPIVIEHEGTTVKLCCESCKPKFEEDPAKYVALVTAAAKDADAGHDDHEGHDHDEDGHEADGDGHDADAAQ